MPPPADLIGIMLAPVTCASGISKRLRKAQSQCHSLHLKHHLIPDNDDLNHPSILRTAALGEPNDDSSFSAH